MNFQVSELPERVQNWLNIVRESTHNTNNPQLKNLLLVEVRALEQLVRGLESGRYTLVDKTATQVNVLRDVYEKKSKVLMSSTPQSTDDSLKQKFIDPVNKPIFSKKEFEQFFNVPLVESTDEKLKYEPKTKLPSFNFSEAKLPPGIDFAIMGGESTVFSRVTYANGEIKREVIDSKDVFKSPEEIDREQISKLTKLSEIQVRLILTANKNLSLYDQVYLCLKKRGEMLAGQGASVEEASVYYADYNIDRVMKELGE